MNEEERGSANTFSRFWNSSINIVASKAVKFVPNVTRIPAQNQDDQTRKEHRRGQVRKAQNKHRKRKEGYLAYLEHEVQNLRTMITTVEVKELELQKENTAIRRVLAAASLLGPFEDGSIISSSTLYGPDSSPDFGSEISPRIAASNLPSSNLVVSMEYDSEMDKSCLYTREIQHHGSERVKHSEELKTPGYKLSSSYDHLAFSPAGQDATSEHRHATSFDNVDLNTQGITTTAVNFILALEHPCRTHFHYNQHLDSNLDDINSISNHELMASTHFYSHAPEAVFSTISASTAKPIFKYPADTALTDTDATSHMVSWQSPQVTLEKLHSMAQSLNSSDFEITPVQAWFLLDGANIIQDLFEKGKLAHICQLKSALATVVDCFGFGAVMDKERFLCIVRETLGDVISMDGDSGRVH